MQLTLPYQELTDIPGSHLYALIVCNSMASGSTKQVFYTLKNEILKKHGHPAGYDLQHIEKRCHSCDGKGNHYTGNTCWHCDKGIYQRKKVVLKRHLLNDVIFHEPVGELSGNSLKIFAGHDEIGYPMFKYQPFTGVIVHEIHGIIKHEQRSLNPVWAYYYLLWHYNRSLFYSSMESEIKRYQTRTQHKLKILIKNNNPLKGIAIFFEVKKQELESIDDLPF